jgi:hypothetical protein
MDDLKEFREAVDDLATHDPAAAEVMFRFVQLINADDKTQSAASMTMLLGQAMSEAEEAYGNSEDATSL